MNVFDPPLIIYVIDDDDTTRCAVSQLVRSMQVEESSYNSAEAFLEAYDGSPGILLCDVRMPGMTGLDLQKSLLSNDVFMPIVLMTGYCRTHLVVDAIRNGATTVLEKPFTREDLLLALHQGLNDYRSGIEPYTTVRNSRIGLAALTNSEGDVLQLLKAGLPNKEIALQLDLSVRTVVLRRKKILGKMNVDNVIELFRIIALLETDDARRARLRLRNPDAARKPYGGLAATGRWAGTNGPTDH